MNKKTFVPTLLLSAVASSYVAVAGPIAFSGNQEISDAALAGITIKLAQGENGLTPAPTGHTYSLASIDASTLAPEAVAAILREISSYYQKNGILATRAVVTKEGYAASRKGKALPVKIVEGKITKTRVVSMDDDQVVSAAKRERIEAAAPLGAGSSVRAHQLDGTVGQMNRFSRQQVHPVLVPENGDLILEYRVKQLAESLGSITFDNYGGERTGEERVSLSFTQWNALRPDDRLSFNALTSFEGNSSFAGVDYMTPLDATASRRLTFNVSYSDYTAEDIGLGISGLDFEGESFTLGLGYEKTLWHGDGAYLDGTIGLRFLDVEQDQTSVGRPITGTQYLLPSIALRYTKSRPNGSFVAGAKLEANIADLANTASDLDPLGRLNAEDSFILGSLYAAYRTHLDEMITGKEGRKHELSLLASANTSFGKRVPPSFLNVQGGFHTVRGYPVGAASGDSAFLVKADYKYHVNRRIPAGTVPNVWDISVGAFTDFGVVTNEDNESFEQDDTLWSIGLGIEAQYKENFSLGLQYGIALQGIDSLTQPVDSGDGELYFTASYKW